MPGNSYPAGILKVGSKIRKTSQASAHHRHRASPVGKKAGMDRKFNVGNLSARRAISSMARALGTKHELPNGNLDQRAARKHRTGQSINLQHRAALWLPDFDFPEISAI